jgi:hypothetical protein
MCMRDLLKRLQSEGLTVSEARLRWAMSTGKVTRPPLDGSLRFDFGEEHVQEILAYLASREASSSRQSAQKSKPSPAPRVIGGHS